MNEKSEAVKADLIKRNIDFELCGDVINRATKTKFKCKKCGHISEITPHNVIINHQGCPFCGPKHRWTYNEIRDTVNTVDNAQYQLQSSESDLIDKVKVSINKKAIVLHKICNKCFSVNLNHFINDNQRCPYCNKPELKSNSEFQHDLDRIYGKMFTLQGDYLGRHKKVTVRCSKCGALTTDYGYNFITNHRNCSSCSMPLCEHIIVDTYPSVERQIKFSDLKYRNPLSYDFRLNNIILECDGAQHFSPIKVFGEKNAFEKQVTRDYTKNMYALSHNLTLIRIFDREIIKKNITSIFNSSTTNDELSNIFENILIIRNGKVELIKGKYLLAKSCTFK